TSFAPIAVTGSGMLKGSGNLLGNVMVHSGGRVRPGNSVGTISVSNITFGNGASLVIEMNPTASSLLLASGAVTIQPGSSINFIVDPGSYQNFKVYQVIQAAALSGVFTN